MRLEKPYTDKQYADLAVYCNNNGKVIKDKGDYLESVNLPEPTVEELQAEVRAVRNQYLNDTDKFILADFPIADAELENYKEYRQYLRDYTKDDGWYSQNPITFEEWKESNSSDSVLSEASENKGQSESESEEVIEDGLQR